MEWWQLAPEGSFIYGKKSSWNDRQKIGLTCKNGHWGKAILTWNMWEYFPQLLQEVISTGCPMNDALSCLLCIIMTGWPTIGWIQIWRVIYSGFFYWNFLKFKFCDMNDNDKLTHNRLNWNLVEHFYFCLFFCVFKRFLKYHSNYDINRKSYRILVYILW